MSRYRLTIMMHESSDRIIVMKISWSFPVYLPSSTGYTHICIKQLNPQIMKI